LLDPFRTDTVIQNEQCAFQTTHNFSPMFDSGRLISSLSLSLRN
jgi:hypothetical protein